MTGKDAAVQAAVNAVAVATQAINDYGRASSEAESATEAARNSVATARQHGATDDDFRNTPPR